MYSRGIKMLPESGRTRRLEVKQKRLRDPHGDATAEEVTVRRPDPAVQRQGESYCGNVTGISRNPPCGFLHTVNVRLGWNEEDASGNHIRCQLKELLQLSGIEIAVPANLLDPMLKFVVRLVQRPVGDDKIEVRMVE